MNRKNFLKWGSAGMFSSALNFQGFGSASVQHIRAGVSGTEVKWNDQPVITKKAMVCASQPLAVATGYDVLKSGGNAIDGAIAVNAMLSLTEPMMCGPGGDLFAMVWSAKDKKLFGLNASGRSPLNWSTGEAKNLGLKAIPSFGPLSWSVPGCVSGWNELLKKFGTKSIAELLRPAIDYGKNGFPVSANIAHDWKAENGVTAFETLNGVFLSNNKGPNTGDIFRNEKLANTFEILARDGANSFYEGEIADRIVSFSKKHGGRFDKKDFSTHKSVWVDPISINYRGYDVWELPPNGQGMVVLQMLNVLEKFDISKLSPGSAQHLHLFLEAKKLCFQDRAIYYADTDFHKAPVEELLSKEYAASRARLIDPHKASLKLQPGRLQNTSNTVYLTVADEDGNMVSLIQSLYSPWGSHYVVDDLGFALQNRGALFSLNETAWNKLEPGKRPFHTIIPAFVTKNNQPVFSFGVTGGDFQPQGQVQILMNIIDHQMSVQQAGNELRLWHRESAENTGESTAEPGKITLEPGFPDKIKQQLQSMGHRFSDKTRYFGGYQGIWKTADPACYKGASDPRKDGCSFGY
jgi:gamma-glutamyltranspeptidase/glutathione hydrolase